MVLDIGCGDGQVTTRLAARGHTVIAVDPSDTMLQRLRTRLEALPRDVARQVTVHRGALEDLRAADVGPVDAVTCHGVLMYLPDSRAAIASLAALVPDGALLSVLTKNSDALALQAGLRGDWTTAHAVLTERRDRTLGNLGLTTRGDTLTDLRAAYDAAGIEPDRVVRRPGVQRPPRRRAPARRPVRRPPRPGGGGGPHLAVPRVWGGCSISSAGAARG
ncbi:class I SAM-dependent methyltransferase [Nocardioides convexus]|uniref:class I SAM-dependent methyltransferase n=1 Tax=Nocardioides convexus TaxID=2712224 RepID=UPI0024187BEB|nr:class I SAM-dependent methyltransferase [Nocardioides convexus]